MDSETLAEHIRENCIKEGHSDLSKINQGTISNILNASNIKPHKISFYIAKVDPEFDQKATRVLATLTFRPPFNFPLNYGSITIISV